MAKQSRNSHEDYRLAWICALPIELAAAKAMFDETHPSLPSISAHVSYSLGKIAGHNIVIACLPGGVYGTTSATAVVSHIKSTFPNIQHGLMVGIAGGVPSNTTDIRLGDVVVSKPTGTLGGVVQYDLGKKGGDRQFQRTGMLNQPPTVLLTAASDMEALSMVNSGIISKMMPEIFRRLPTMEEGFSRPLKEDRLFQSKSPTEQINRAPRLTSEPRIHYGIVASGNSVIKDGRDRDAIGQESNALCFEMEAAGIMNHLPCLVVRGICDYCDSHKNKEWQGYAALVAAIYAKNLLSFVPARQGLNKQPTYRMRDEELQGGNNLGSVSAEFQSYTTEDIDRFCLRDLRCPDSLVVKNRLKESKDKLLRQSFEWILQDPQYESWQNGTDVCLLWIKGGAGKGKTMMSIGLIEELSRISHQSTVVTYSFCQNADNKLNTPESIIKGLILQLMNQQIGLRESLRCRWDTVHNQFNEDITSWKNLWDILMEMLNRCQCSKVYIIVDALDECQDNGMADFFKRVVRNGLDHPSKIKWLLTSRPLDSAERALLVGRDQVQVSLDLNSEHVSKAVEAYITNKVDELSHRHGYTESLRAEVKTVLTAKAEGTFLWVSLVCKTLEGVSQDEALTTILNLPPGVYHFYDRVLNQLSEGEPDDFHKCMRLLKAMMLAYRPLRVEEVPSVTGLTNKDNAIQALVNRCASFITIQERSVEFVHQSARDYLAGDNGKSILDSRERFEHDEIVLSSLSYLSERLKVNLIDLPRPDSTRESSKPPKDEKQSSQLSCLEYAATFWVQHLGNIKRRAISQSELSEKGGVGIFLHTKLLEWLECLSLLDKLPQAIEALKELATITRDDPSALALVQDATRFLLRHSHTMTHWPLQIYSSAVIFSPESSIVKRENSEKIPVYLRNVPLMKETLASVIQTLAEHSHVVNTVAFSPDGTRIASGSDDKSIKLWDAATGSLQKTLIGHSNRVKSLAFSPDGTQIVSGSDDETIKLWDTATGGLQRTLIGHSDWVRTVAFSPDGMQIASGSDDRTIKLWDTTTGRLQKTLKGHSKWVYTVAFSPDGMQIASGSEDETIKLWDTTNGSLHKTLKGHSGWVMTVAFSPDSMQIVSGSGDRTIKLWDTATGSLQRTLIGHSDWVYTVAFSPDSAQIASGSSGGEIKLWDTATGDLQMTLEGHINRVYSVAFSPDGTQIVSGSMDETIKLWDTATGGLQKTLEGHSDWVRTVAFSPDGTQIASGSDDKTIKLWDTATGRLQKTLKGHLDLVTTVAFSPDGIQLASGSNDKTIKLWDTEKGDLQKTLKGHSDYVRAVAFSPDGTQIASVSDDKTIKLWDTAKGDLQKTLKGHSGSVYTVAFSPDGTQIVSGSIDETIKLWDTATGGLQKTLIGHSGIVKTVAFSPDGMQIASGSADKTVRIWDTATGGLEKTLNAHINRVFTLAFSPDGTQIVSGSDDRTIKLWNTATGGLQKTLKGHSNSVRTVAFSPDGTQIASGSNDKTIKLWDTATGGFQKTLIGHSDIVRTVAFSPDGTQIVSGSNDKTIKLWDTATGSLQKTLKGHSDYVRTVAFSPDGTQIASSSNDKTIKLWDTATSDLRKTLKGHSKRVFTLAFSPDGTQIVSGSDDRTIKLWDTATGSLQRTLIGHSDWVYTVAFSPDSAQIASGSSGGEIKLWDTATGDLQMTLEGHINRVYSVAFSPDGMQIVSGSMDQTIKLWDTATGGLQKTLEGHSDWVRTVAFSPDGTQIASGSDDKTIKLWDTETGRLQKTLKGHSDLVRTVAFSPDGTQITSGSNDKTIELWGTATGGHQKTRNEHPVSVNTVALSPDGTQIVSGSADGTVRIWDTATSELRKILIGHSDSVRTVAFSPDGTQIASGSDDNTIKLWDTATAGLQMTLESHWHWVRTVAFSPDGTQIASGSADRTVRIWDTVTGELQKKLKGHSDYVNTVIFSPDGTQIASGSDDKTIKLWDTATGGFLKTLKGHSDYVNTVIFSPDGTQIASGSDEEIIKLWDIDKSLHTSKSLGRYFISRFRLKPRKEIKTSQPVYSLRYSAGNWYLPTDIGPIKSEGIATDKRDDNPYSVHNLFVRGQWICYADMPFLRLPSGFEPSSHDVRGDHVAIGFKNGRVLSFDIDRRILQSILGYSEVTVKQTT